MLGVFTVETGGWKLGARSSEEKRGTNGWMARLLKFSSTNSSELQPVEYAAKNVKHNCEDGKGRGKKAWQQGNARKIDNGDG